MSALQELQSSRQLQLSTAVSVLSIAGKPQLGMLNCAALVASELKCGCHVAFNYCGISVTKNLSGAARATIDACRTLLIWAFSLSVHAHCCSSCCCYWRHTCAS